jgi:single-stranded DNA-binding protein
MFREETIVTSAGKELKVGFLFGRFVQDTELVNTPSGKTVGKNRVADNYGKEPQFVDVAAWDEKAELLAKFPRKGEMAMMSGTVSEREHNGKVYKTLTIQHIEFVPRAGAAGAAGEKQQAVGAAASAKGRGKKEEKQTVPADDDLPF